MRLISRKFGLFIITLKGEGGGGLKKTKPQIAAEFSLIDIPRNLDRN